MSRIFGEIIQAGFVVRDIQAAMRHWVDVMGVGPWYYIEDSKTRNFTYKGKPSNAQISIALANSGSLQIELIQQHNEGPSLYRDFLDAGHEGLQHVAYPSENFAADVQRYLDLGYELGQAGLNDRGSFAYLLTEAHPGTIIEILEMTESRRQIYTAIAEEARNWDGSDPIRTVFPT